MQHANDHLPHHQHERRGRLPESGERAAQPRPRCYGRRVCRHREGLTRRFLVFRGLPGQSDTLVTRKVRSLVV